jgi:UDP-N-acetylglucosamine--N-acetylmuramyl-(pentapeptide) pyrophosphoryl-undecaprenol N-acetylglucosamine transferase
MVRARRRAIDLLAGLEPSVVVSVGGYASMPAVFAARRLDIPVVVVSYDRTPGRASQFSARRAAASAVAFEGSTLPRATVTGAPVRQAILDVDRSAHRASARARLGVPGDRFLVAVMGGSLGSGVLNDAIGQYVDEHRDDSELAVRQVAGERFADAIETVDEIDGVIHQVVGYEADMPAVYAAADVLVGRGGASTVHEVAVTGVPAILVPWSGASEDHQRANVEWLSEAGGAIMLGDGEIDRLGEVLDQLRADAVLRDEMGVAARERGELHRSGALARLVERVAVTSDPS